MPLSEEDALLLRDGDIVLVPMQVEHTNNHYDKPSGVKVACLSPQNLYMREEREKGPPRLDIQSSRIHSIAHLMLRINDRVEWDASGPGASFEPERGKVVFIDGGEITIRQDKERTPRNRVILKSALRRISSKGTK